MIYHYFFSYRLPSMKHLCKIARLILLEYSIKMYIFANAHCGTWKTAHCVFSDKFDCFREMEVLHTLKTFLPNTLQNVHHFRSFSVSTIDRIVDFQIHHTLSLFSLLLFTHYPHFINIMQFTNQILSCWCNKWQRSTTNMLFVFLNSCAGHMSHYNLNYVAKTPSPKCIQLFKIFCIWNTCICVLLIL